MVFKHLCVVSCKGKNSNYTVEKSDNTVVGWPKLTLHLITERHCVVSGVK